MTCFQVQFTIDDLDKGRTIADELLGQRLIGCVQEVGPIRSRYWWRGTLTESEEWLFLCKTSERRLDATIEAIAERHPYETPEVIATPIASGLTAYLDWIEAETDRSDEAP